MSNYKLRYTKHEQFIYFKFFFCLLFYFLRLYSCGSESNIVFLFFKKQTTSLLHTLNNLQLLFITLRNGISFFVASHKFKKLNILSSGEMMNIYM